MEANITLKIFFQTIELNIKGKKWLKNQKYC